MDDQQKWDSEDILRAVEKLAAAQQAVENLEREKATLQVQLRRMPRRIEEAKWKRAEALRVLQRAAGVMKA